MGDLRNSFVDILRPFRHDDQCLLLVALVQHMEYLRGGILKNNGIQRLVPAKQCSGDSKDHHISRKNIIPGINAVLFRQEDRDKIRTAAGGIGEQTQADGQCIDQSTEDSNQQNILRYRPGGHHIRQNTAHHDHQTGITGELFSDEFEADDHRNRI